MALAKGEDTFTIVWDMEKFYDNKCIEKLVQEAWSLGYTMLIFRLGVMMHMAPRALKSMGMYLGMCCCQMA